MFGVHGIGGIVGSLLTGVLASRSISGMPGQLSLQLTGVAIVVVYSAVMSGLLLWLTRALIGLRVDETVEQTGLDISLHREQLGM